MFLLSQLLLVLSAYILLLALLLQFLISSAQLPALMLRLFLHFFRCLLHPNRYEHIYCM